MDWIREKAALPACCQQRNTDGCTFGLRLAVLCLFGRPGEAHPSQSTSLALQSIVASMAAFSCR